MSFSYLRHIWPVFFVAPSLAQYGPLEAPAAQPTQALQASWGLAGVIRSATVTYDSQDSGVSSFVPLMFFENEYIKLNGTEGMLRLTELDGVDINAVMRMRFIDIPKQYQNQIGGDTSDFGLQFHYEFKSSLHGQVDSMWDPDGRFHSNLTLLAEWQTESGELTPYVTARYKSDSFNSYYYGFGNTELSSGLDVATGVDGRYHMFSNLYLLGGAQARYLDSAARNNREVASDWEFEGYVGIGLFNKPINGQRSISNKPYVRVAHGWATPSNIGDIFTGNIEKDPNNNQSSSIFYGHPLTDQLFSLPIDIYLTPGLAWHHKNTDQATGVEYILAIKAYYSFSWPTEWRLGVGEGLSYVNRISQVEREEMEEKGYRPSQLLNYLDVSVDVNVGDLVNQPQWNNVWLGYSLHHRSAIFETASQFGRIKGGSNYNTVYLQWDF